MTKERKSKIEQLHRPMAPKMEAKYTERNQHVTDVRPGFVDETTFGEVVKSLHHTCHAYTFDLPPQALPASWITRFLSGTGY